LIDSRDLFPGQKMIIESEIHTNDLAVFRIRIRWLELDESERPYLLVTIEDRRQSTQNAAIADAKKYGFTPREAQIWLLRRANHSYKEIAAQLYITLNTVKKHMKNIYAKQQANLWVQE
jgi:DNA-binding CsgD family transcriptional regulator